MILERIHQVQGNVVRNFNIRETDVDKDYPWSGILAAGTFSIRSTTNSIRGYSTRQLLFGRDMVLFIKHKVHWGLILHQK